MLLPHALYVLIFLAISAMAAAFVVYVLMKAVPRSGSRPSKSVRGCAGAFAFIFLFFACLVGLMWIVPTAHVVIAGPDKEHTRKEAILFTSDELAEKYDISDFEFDRSYIVNTTDRNMVIFSTSDNVDETDSLIIEIPAHECTPIETRYLPDHYFGKPADTDSPGTNRRKRWILDYTPTNH